MRSDPVSIIYCKALSKFATHMMRREMFYLEATTYGITFLEFGQNS